MKTNSRLQSSCFHFALAVATILATCGEANAQSKTGPNPLRRSARSTVDIARRSAELVAERPAARETSRVDRRSDSSKIRPASYGFPVDKAKTVGFVPRHERAVGTSVIVQDEPEVILPGAREVRGDITFEFEGGNFDVV